VQSKVSGRKFPFPELLFATGSSAASLRLRKRLRLRRLIVLIEHLDQLGEVGERSGQPIDLVDDDYVDPPKQVPIG